MTTPLPSREGAVREVFLAFLKLGLTAFGGPIAHLGYFRAEFVHRRRWLDEAAYADLVALCQFLPGPASSQVGFSLGVMRGRGLAGGLAAWAAFTLPSALLLLAFAYGADALGGPVGSGIVHGLKLVAVAVVAQAVWGMGRTLAPDATRAAIAFAALALTTVLTGSTGQVAGIGLGAVAGLVVCRRSSAAAGGHLGIPVSRRAGAVALFLFGLFLAVPPILAKSLSSQGFALFDAFYRSGALVFGGGHVMLPLLRTALVETGWIGPDAFLAGYGAAQAVPGPLFTFAAYLGAALGPQPNGLVGAAIALVAVFLPGLLLVYGALPFWDAVRERPLAQAAMRGANAAVVGILAAALYDPLWTGAVLGPRDFAVAAGAFLLLTIGAAPPWIVVALTVVAGAGLTVVGG
ncbi:chromate efflux transporter [Methylobacterium sp. W2]|uniref:chromate efflux transporter n=1 Tax=Methylobacterium sp. W2 TaxID=2598107 RepID=UPI001D0CA650|nr:chromate efflux transporter [Methylobacterium sp. W2]MCC0808757.1 chromate efflux transporter [Methylobacterium sp. W2]